jgi:hypothetical protein
MPLLKNLRNNFITVIFLFKRSVHQTYHALARKFSFFWEKRIIILSDPVYSVVLILKNALLWSILYNTYTLYHLMN